MSSRLAIVSLHRLDVGGVEVSATPWRLSTKYYDADVRRNLGPTLHTPTHTHTHAHAHAHPPPHPQVEVLVLPAAEGTAPGACAQAALVGAEALLLVVDATQPASASAAQRAWAQVLASADAPPAILACVVNKCDVATGRVPVAAPPEADDADEAVDAAAAAPAAAAAAGVARRPAGHRPGGGRWTLGSRRSSAPPARRWRARATGTRRASAACSRASTRPCGRAWPAGRPRPRRRRGLSGCWRRWRPRRRRGAGGYVAATVAEAASGLAAGAGRRCVRVCVCVVVGGGRGAWSGLGGGGGGGGVRIAEGVS
jgi:hypothetical protein